ncbi:hypothetical protein P2G88_00305 [Aliiglaciecola sp. CAU 1673]|uniref:hypothetical protein n=1 Tax=Aliiglaciecola sp. CAU 1673 TaxID=3032595 RepID=UPI0023DAAF61|nr:hypothetical protein [Aliiglaciecola sp. CAU 1673]MDF2176688.1 hypothetical protein [Aliiglaciecola sp. CAU 1673]
MSKSLFSKHQLAFFIALSLLLHVLLALWLASQNSDVTPNTAKQPAIVARLYMPTPPVTVPEPLEQPEPVKVPDKNDIAATDPITEMPAEAPPEQAPGQPTEVSEKSAVPQEEIRGESAKTRNTSDNNQPFNLNSLVRRQLGNMQQMQRQQLGEQAAREFRQQQTNPIGHIPDIQPMQSEEETFLESQRIEANCDNNAKAAIAGVLSLMGGQVRCSRPPDFQQYIDRRLNKNP